MEALARPWPSRGAMSQSVASDGSPDGESVSRRIDRTASAPCNISRKGRRIASRANTPSMGAQKGLGL